MGFGDACRFDNHHFSGKTWHKIGTKNVIIKTLGKKKSVNVFGFQPLNGVPILSFFERTNRATFSLHQMEVRIANMANEKVAEKIYKFVNCEELTENYIKDQLTADLPSNDELNEQVVAATEKKYENATALDKRIKNIFGALNIKSKQIVEIQEQLIYKWMENNQQIKEELSNEKRIIMVVDNHKAHLSVLARNISKFLNIKLLFLPTHSPKLNPIEQVWRSMKKKISSIDFETIESLLTKVKHFYSHYAKKKTFTDGWIEKFISKS